MKNRLIVCLIALALCAPFLSVSVSAQDEPAPLVFFGRGLFLLNEETGHVTAWSQCGDGFGIRISPTGEWIARLQDDSDLRLCNLYTREIIDIPAPVERDGAFASYPSWSPDGGQIAWSASYETGEHVLMTYDLASNEAQVLVDDLLPFYPRPQVLWGESGIVVVIENRSDEEGRVAPLYSPTGELLAEDLSNHIFFALYAWVTDDNGKEYLARYTNSAIGDLVDPETGIIYFAQGIEMYSPLAPDGLIVTVTTNSEQTKALVELPDGDT
ncbi:MAG: PD40 domain-containing protein, partial [Burkholderiales bacterium]|nr:PD40 domain-containing protein [Anaerolineae bacterium]